jgi:hypothetical protein
MNLSLVFAVMAASLLSGQAAGPSLQVQTEAPARLSPAEISQLRAKAEAGDAAAQLALGRAYKDGNGVPRNAEEAVRWHRMAAEQGNPAAQRELSLMYLEGRGVEQNKEEAFKWCQKAARQKHPIAMFNVGAAYFNGEGVAENVISAYAWFVLAQEAGSESAAEAVKRMGADLQHISASAVFEKIADMYEKGNDLPRNYAEALKWYRRAAEGGGPTVRVKLAGLLVEEKKYDEARRLCEEAVKQSYSPANYCLGYLYDHGLGVARNPPEAAKWFGRAAEMGHSRSMLRLGQMYVTGDGVKPDKKTAYFYFFLAASVIPEAKQEQASLEKELSSKDVEKTKKKAIEWARQHQLQRAGIHPLTPRSKTQTKK